WRPGSDGGCAGSPRATDSTRSCPNSRASAISSNAPTRPRSSRRPTPPAPLRTPEHRERPVMSTEAERIGALAAAGARLAAVGAKPAGEAGTAAGVPVFRHDYGDSPDQFVEVYGDPATASATVVFVHGGYFRPRTDLSHARPLAVSLAES